MGKAILFVYGTLKRGMRNHRLIADQEFLGEAVSEPRYRMIDLGSYPGLVVDTQAGLAVQGELWAISDCCLEELDDFEGVPTLFVRHSIAITGWGESMWAYYWNGAIPTAASSGSAWPIPRLE